MNYIKDKNELKTIKEIAAKYNVPTSLVRSRYNRGIREVEKLIQPKYAMVEK